MFAHSYVKVLFICLLFSGKMLHNKINTAHELHHIAVFSITQ